MPFLTNHQPASLNRFVIKWRNSETTSAKPEKSCGGGMQTTLLFGQIRYIAVGQWRLPSLLKIWIGEAISSDVNIIPLCCHGSVVMKPRRRVKPMNVYVPAPWLTGTLPLGRSYCRVKWAVA